MTKGKSRIIALTAALITLLIGLLVITGWFLQINLLKSFIPGGVSAKFNAAVAFVLASVVIIINIERAGKKQHAVSTGLSLIIALIGLLTLVQYVSGYNIGIDEFFLKDSSLHTADTFAGRIPPISAINLLLIGVGLLLLHSPKAATYHFVYLTFIAFISFFILVGFSFIPDIPAFIRISLPAAIAFISICVAIWFGGPMLRDKINFKQRMVAGFIASIILLLLIILFSYYYSNQRNRTANMVNHTNEVLSEAQQTLSLVKDIESSGRAYIITADSAYLTYFTTAKKAVFEHVNKLKKLTVDNPPQQVRVDSLRQLLEKRIAFSTQYIKLRNEKGFAAAAGLMVTTQGKTYTTDIRAITSAIQAEENSLLAQRQIKNAASISLFNRAFSILLLSILILMIIIFFSMRRNIARRESDGEKLQQFNRELEQKIAERTEQINRSEKRYRHLFENNPLPMWVMDLDTFKFLDVNEMAVLQYGYSRQEFLAMTAVDIRPEADREFFIQSDHSVRIANTGYNRGIWTHRKKDGTLIQVEIIGQDIIFEGMPARFILANDVTERKKTEEKLIASEKQFRYTLDNMLEGIQIIDFNWRYVYINDSFTKHAKYSREQLIGYTVMEKYPGIEKTNIFQVYQRCFTERVSIHQENEFIFPDGSRGWFELSFQPVPEGIFILSIDITERKKIEESIRHAEANYREIFEKASDAIHVIEIGTWKVLDANQEASDITGYSKAELMEGRRQNQMTDDTRYSLEKVAWYMEEAATGDPQLFEWLTRNKDGSSNWLEVNLQKATIAGEDRLLAFYREINDRKIAQQQIQELNESLEQKVAERTTQLEKVNKELEAFSYSVSHDLRAPLRGIIGFTSMLQTKYGNHLDDEGKRITSVIMNNTLRMGSLIDDLLSFSRLGRQEIMMGKINTAKLVQDLLPEIDNKEKPVSWQIAALPDCRGDVNTIRQVWINLLSNAVKYSKNAVKPEVQVGSYIDNNETVFFIKDNGVGFDAKYMHKLFKVFQRLHSANEFEGTGVGLAIVEKIISKHGGRVWAGAEKNKGATFFFSLPQKHTI